MTKHNKQNHRLPWSRCLRLRHPAAVLPVVVLAVLAWPACRAEERNEIVTSNDPATVLWYSQPAEQWIEALPVGNGRLGAMVFGGVAAERIQLNEQTVWTGGPYDPTRAGGPEALGEIRRLVFAGKFYEAQDLFGRAMMGRPAEQQKYQPLGNLRLEFPGHPDAADYRRHLDLATAVAGVRYRAGGVTFAREVFVSPVDQVIVVRLTADQPGKLTFAVHLEGVANAKTPGDATHSTEVAAGGRLVLRGKTATYQGIEGRVKYQAEVRILHEGGTLAALTPGKDGAASAPVPAAAASSAVTVAGADSATLLIAAATNFKRYDDLSGDPEAKVRQCLDLAAKKTCGQLRAAHVAEHRRLFGRVRMTLPATAASALPTDQRLRAWDGANDPPLAALMFQYGRYLLLCSSRPLCQPANLQGIWNEDMDPAWECKFTTNINLEMNYWPAEAANLPECVEPLTRMVKELAGIGARVAKIHYGAGGWVFHQNADQWRHAAPMDGPTWGTFSVGGAWLCTHLWEHYLFSGDADYLRDIYPLLTGSARFFLDTLVEDPQRHWLVTCPATSPENFPACPGNGPYLDPFTGLKLPGTTICAGPTMDMQILRDLFDACGEAGRILGRDADLRERIAQARRRLAPMQIGRHGQIQEWLDDWEDLEPRHRHLSHLYGLYPSRQISPADTPQLAEAAKVSLGLRGDAGTGFGMAWKACCWARLADGDHALLCLTNLASQQTCPNLFSKCFKAPQVDGSLGAAAAVAEMLLQSQGGEVHLLPALPKAWPAGSVSGLRARGGFEVDIDWKDAALTQAVIRSRLGRPCTVRYAGQTVTFDTQAGKSFRVARAEAGGPIEWRRG